jgi:photosynthetic reaction center cytochrome c subunit
MRTPTIARGVAVLLAILVAGCELGPKEFTQMGWRGLAIEHNKDVSNLQDSVNAVASRVPEALPVPPVLDQMPDGLYENVQVLGHLSEVEFTLTMNALTAWVSPEQGCSYCHVQYEDGSYNYALEDKYTKHVARSMLMMTQDINVNWSSHVNDEQGVNCWTCHQGNPVPTNFWFFTDRDQPLRHYLDRDDLRVQGEYANVGDGPRNVSSIDQTMYAYTLMSYMSNALGVNCTYCHNTARFADWSESSPQRVTALRGLRMIRNANMSYMVPLQDTWPDNRLGPMGDGPKLQCSTCHQGAYKPQYSHPSSSAVGWRALTETGYPNAAAED